MPLDTAARETFLSDHADWELDGETISRTYEFGDFPPAVAFVTEVAFAAEAADHHPDIDIRWNKVTLALTTHSEKSLTEKDTDLATQFDDIAS